jgi:RecA-family ATPase
MDGDPGLGKSATVLDVAARVSTGREFPDGTSNDVGPGGVVILSAEDGLSDTIKPRLEAAGADLERIDIQLSRISLGC